MSIKITQLKRLRAFVAAFKAWQPSNVDRFNMIVYYMVNDCGTACCAFGYASTLLDFQRVGLDHDERNRDITYTTRGKEHRNLGAAMRFFGLTSDEAMRVFIPSEYPRPYDVTKGEVQRRLAALLRAKEREFTDA